jgi:CDP-diacylglycerol--serine O-phosphatidyltransferase
MKIMRSPKIIRAEFKERLYRRRFILPNAVTVGALFCGFLACIYGATGQFQKAAIAIGIAIILDGLDGRVARRLNATSKFGLEFDSLSDVISFGVAPAVVAYFWCFRSLADQFGVFLCFLYVLAAAGRLARFNITASELKSFNGLPTPGAAGALAGLVNFWPTALPPSFVTTTIFSILLVGLSFLMVSNVQFFSIKLIRVSAFTLRTQLAIGSLIGLLWYDHQIGLMVLGFGYVASGFWGVVNKYKKQQREGATSPQAGSGGDSDSRVA